MIITDSGFWVAIFHPNDKHHQKAVQKLRQYDQEDLMTTWPILTETTHLIYSRTKDTQKIINFVTYYEQNNSIFSLNITHIPRIKELMEQYKNLPMDLADASLVILAEHLGHGRILSTDQRDFNTYRWKNTHPFENLML